MYNLGRIYFSVLKKEEEEENKTKKKACNPIVFQNLFRQNRLEKMCVLR